MSNAMTRLCTWFKGELVGQDAQGNRYYRTGGGGEVHRDSLRHERRWVVYNGDIEASRVPADWHGWLHHTVDQPPPEGGLPRYDWMAEHQPNLTGTDRAVPKSSPSRQVRDYEAWRPDA